MGIKKVKIESQRKAFLESLRTEVACLNTDLFCSNFIGPNLNDFKAKSVDRFYNNYDIAMREYLEENNTPNCIKEMFNRVTKNILSQINETTNEDLAKFTSTIVAECLPLDKIIQVVARVNQFPCCADTIKENSISGSKREVGKKLDLPGFKRDKKNNLIFDLTEEEQQEVKSYIEVFEEYKFRPDVVDNFQKGIAAFALSEYAAGQTVMLEAESSENREKLLEKAIAAILKAYSIYSLPVYIFQLACYFQLIGKIDEAREMFKDFLKKQSDFKPGKFDEIFLGRYDIDEIIEIAEANV